VQQNVFWKIDLKPIDWIAKKATLPGVHFIPDKKVTVPVWEIAPSIVKFTGPKKDDISGLRRGRLTTIGYLGHWPLRSKKKKHKLKGLWLTRCDCGLYEPRTARAMKNVKNWQERCQKCRAIYYIKRNQKFRERRLT
jgi:hypothetical protein